MKKVLLNLAVPAMLVCNAFTSQAKTVDVATAQKVGCNYLLSQNIPGISSAADLTLSHTQYATVNGASVADYYVFNFVNGGGFVMVSADDLVIPVLAYSAERTYKVDNMSPEANYWVTGYANQITYVIANNLPAKAGTAKKWSDLIAGVPKKAARTTTITFPSSTAFLCTTLWDQTSHYNDQCPGSGSTKAVTGCVATAMAQVMKYNNWPSVGTGDHSYDSSNYGNLNADFGNTVYQWSSMPNTVTTTNNAVAQLMLHAGISVNMNYSPTESGSYVASIESPFVNCAEYALKTYFHYKPTTVKGIARFGEYYLVGTTPTYYVDSMTTSAWITMLEGEITAQRPVLYTGRGSDGGHCWVCDGYNSSDFFHFNFGWSGESNGFYSVDDIAPPALGTGGGGSGNNFNSDQCAIIGIIPDSFANTTGNLKMLAHLNCPFNSPGNYGQRLTVTTKILNSATTTFKGDFSVEVFDTNNVMIDTIQTIRSQTVTAGDSTAVLTFTKSGAWAMPQETYYHIECVYRPTGTTAWTPIANNGTFINYNVIDVENDTDILLYDSLNVTTGHTMLINRPISVSTQVANYSSGDFNGELEGLLINTATGTVFNVQTITGVSLPYQTYGSFTFANSSAAVVVPGRYAFVVKHEYTSGGLFYTTGSNYFENPVMINIYSPVSVNTVPDVTDAINVYPNPATNLINIAMTGVEVSEIRISDVQGREMQTITPTSQSMVSVSLDNYATGVYFVQAMTPTGVITKKIVVTK